MFDDYNHRAEQDGEEARVASAPTYTSGRDLSTLQLFQMYSAIIKGAMNP